MTITRWSFLSRWQPTRTCDRMVSWGKWVVSCCTTMYSPTTGWKTYTPAAMWTQASRQCPGTDCSVQQTWVHISYWFILFFFFFFSCISFLHFFLPSFLPSLLPSFTSVHFFLLQLLLTISNSFLHVCRSCEVSIFVKISFYLRVKIIKSMLIKKMVFLENATKTVMVKVPFLVLS